MVAVPGKSKGCATCRRRKIGCDLQQPECGQCTKFGRTCEGYDRFPVFINRTGRGLEKREHLNEAKPRSAHTAGNILFIAKPPAETAFAGSHDDNSDNVEEDMELHAMEYIQMELATSPEAISWVDQFTTKRRVRSLGDRRWSTESRRGHPPPSFQSLREPLGAGRRDPFGQYPIRQTFNVDFLIDHFIIQFATVSHKLLPLYRNDSASFRAMLTFAAKHVAGQQGLTETLASASHRAYALETIRARLGDPRSKISDGTLIAAAVLASADECWGETAAARNHWNGLKAMLRSRGGLRAVLQNRLLHTALLRLDIVICTGCISSSQHPYSTTNHGSLPLGISSDTYASANAAAFLSDGTTIAEAQEIICVSDEFVAFVSSLKTQMNAEQELTQPPHAPSPAPIMLSILASKNIGRLGTRIEKCCEMACLLYLAAVSLDFPISRASTRTPIPRWIEQMIQTRIEASHMRFDAVFLFTLFQGDEHAPLSDIDGQQLWLVSRLMSVAKKLSEPSWDRLVQMLMSFLNIFPQEQGLAGLGWGPRFIMWELEELRKEVYGELYTMVYNTTNLS